jgi:ribosomal protein S18 acetylase RimI-like enzyme
MITKIRPVSPGRWDDAAEVMGGNGGYGGCWCMFWRLDNQEIHTKTASDNQAALRQMIAAGQSIGLLLYQDNQPAGWCQVAPRLDFWRLFHTRGLRLEQPDDPSVWSITCVYVARGARCQGAGRQLVRAAVEYAGQHGASVIEAYPVVDASKGRRTQLSSGTVDMFSEVGFTIAAPPAGRRVTMRRLPPGARPSQAGHGQYG